MILGYYDDRMLLLLPLIAQLECDAPVRTSVTILTDKEEIGSVGATGMNSSLKMLWQRFWFPSRF